MSDAASFRTRWLRFVVLLIAGIEALVLVAVSLMLLGSLGSSEALTRNIAQGVLLLAAAIAVPVGTALILGLLDRWLWLALALAVLALAAPAVLFPYL